MGAVKLLLSQARRHGLSKPFSSPFPHFPRHLSSSSSSSSDANSSPDPNPNPRQNESLRKPVTIEPVSYAVKPKDPAAEDASPPPPQAESAQDRPPRRFPDSAATEARTNWTREEIRYVKDAPSISPVSYPMRVAPLPEDRVAAETEGNAEEMEKERKKIEAENRARRRYFRAAQVEDDTASLPLPTLIKPELKQGKRPVVDLMEALREIKVSFKA